MICGTPSSAVLRGRSGAAPATLHRSPATGCTPSSCDDHQMRLNRRGIAVAGACNYRQPVAPWRWVHVAGALDFAGTRRGSGQDPIHRPDHLDQASGRFRVDPHPAERLNRERVNGVELPGGAQGDRFGADLKDMDLSGQLLDFWFISAAHKRILTGKDLGSEEPTRRAPTASSYPGSDGLAPASVPAGFSVLVRWDHPGSELTVRCRSPHQRPNPAASIIPRRAGRDRREQDRRSGDLIVAGAASAVPADWLRDWRPPGGAQVQADP